METDETDETEISIRGRQISPADGWYYLASITDLPTGRKTYVWRVAVWALEEDGRVRGFVGVPTNSNTHGKWHGCLAGPPPCHIGEYKHESELTDIQKRAYATGSTVEAIEAEEVERLYPQEEHEKAVDNSAQMMRERIKNGTRA